jgi:hypothetical protein
MKRDLERRLAALEAKVNSRVIMISTWADLIRVADLEDRGIDVKVECTPEMQELVDMVARKEEVDESNR